MPALAFSGRVYWKFARKPPRFSGWMNGGLMQKDLVSYKKHDIIVSMEVMRTYKFRIYPNAVQIARGCVPNVACAMTVI